MMRYPDEYVVSVTEPSGVHTPTEPVSFHVVRTVPLQVRATLSPATAAAYVPRRVLESRSVRCTVTLAGLHRIWYALAFGDADPTLIARACNVIHPDESSLRTVPHTSQSSYWAGFHQFCDDAPLLTAAFETICIDVNESAYGSVDQLAPNDALFARSNVSRTDVPLGPTISDQYP
jgi:hypothetical protein